MKKYLILLLLLMMTTMASEGAVHRKTVLLHDGWQFSQLDRRDWHRAEVPGTVQQDLLRCGLLPDPFYGTNEQHVQWVEDLDWIYRTTFSVSADDLRFDAAELVFEGLDTYAEVKLNGETVFQADNMFVGHRLAVKPLLREGDNTLEVTFRSPIKENMWQYERDGFSYPADNDHRREKLSIYARKAPYSFGWDWGIRMVTCGIWRPVRLCFADRVAVDDLHVCQRQLTDSVAVLACRGEVRRLRASVGTLRAVVTASLKGHEVASNSCDVRFEGDSLHVDIPLTISQPQRWMPNGWGDPTLYEVTLSLTDGGSTLCSKSRRVGLRTVRVVTEKDEAGESFYFEVNGHPMFAKGANYIPMDAMLPSVTEERYRRMFDDVKEANMNMLRVWGGGVYESDLFYDLADEYGILLWQDFMFACTTYPHDEAFLARVKAEAEYNVRRLRNHPSLAMWCGNNEIEEGIKYWGWKGKLPNEAFESMKTGYDRIFRELLPEVVAQYDPDRFYAHTSPYFANWGRKWTMGVRDCHNWGVWYGRKTFESFDEDIPRFMSEFGFQSFPEMKTLRTFAAEEDFELESEVMNAHQKSSIGNDLIRKYMERDYRVPESFEDFVYVGSVLQGRGMRHGMEAHRRNRPYCMGTLYWQLNDSWPVVSWSGIDYYGNWKALHYQARRAFAPVIADVVQRERELEVWAISDRLTDVEGAELRLQLTDFEGNVYKQTSTTLTVAANTSAVALRVDLDKWLHKRDYADRYVLVTLLDADRRVLFREPHYLVPARQLHLPKATVEVAQHIVEGGCELRLRSDVLVRDLFVSTDLQGARFSDNFFDLLPGEERVVMLTSPQIHASSTVNLRVAHLRATYEE